MTHLTPKPMAALLLGAALTVPAAAAPPMASPLAKAKTMQVTETVTDRSVTGKPGPTLTFQVQIARPNKVRVDLTAPGSSLYVSDGSTVYAYMGARKKYAKLDVPAPGESPDSDISGAYSGGNVALLLQNGVPQAEGRLPAPTVTVVPVNGKPMTLFTQTAKMRGGVVLSYQQWNDAKTGLPARRSVFYGPASKMIEVETITFTGWKLNQPIADAQFAWTPPADATEYKVPKLLAKGTPAPDFEAIAPDGTKVHLSDFKGKPVVIDFWATWCGPCQQSMPHLESVYKQIPAGQVAVLGVCVWDQKAAYDKWLVDKKGVYTFPTVFDPAGRGAESIATKLFGVSGIPTQYVIDKDGNVVAANVGYEDGDHRLEASLQSQGISVTVPTEKKTASK